MSRDVVQQFIDSEMMTNTIERDHEWTQLMQQIDTLNDDVERSIQLYEQVSGTVSRDVSRDVSR